MGNRVSIKDNRKYEEDYFSDIKSLKDEILDKSLKELKKKGIFVFPEVIGDSEDLDGKQKILYKEGNFYHAGNLMGFIGKEGIKGELLSIHSRFGDEENDYFFHYLLDKVLNFNILELPTETNQDLRLFDLLLFIFPFFLKKALRKGIYKEYVRNEYNSMNMRGTLDIARHIKNNTPFVGKVAYSRREFSYDNNTTELIRHTIEYIKGKPYGKKILSKVQDEVNQIVETTSRYEFFDRAKVIHENKKKTIKNAYFHEYRDLQRLCLMILQHRKHQFGDGKQLINGVLFDGAWLWEEYTNIIINEKEENYHHPKNKGKKGEKNGQNLFYKYYSDDEELRKAQRIYPDFISKGKTNRVVADAKYRPFKNIKRDDYFQILTYMFRFDAKTGFFFYPEDETKEEENARDKDITLSLAKGSTFDDEGVSERDDKIVVIKHGLVIPQNAKSYEDFKQKMQASEREFLRGIQTGHSCDKQSQYADSIRDKEKEQKTISYVSVVDIERVAERKQAFISRPKRF